MGIGYVEELSDGLRHDDPMIGIKCPEAITVLSAKDAAWPLLADRDLW
jgi:dTDP-4-dehydrorhamnose 3,5-epimerase